METTITLDGQTWILDDEYTNNTLEEAISLMEAHRGIGEEATIFPTPAGKYNVYYREG